MGGTAKDAERYDRLCARREAEQRDSADERSAPSRYRNRWAVGMGKQWKLARIISSVYAKAIDFFALQYPDGGRMDIPSQEPGRSYIDSPADAYLVWQGETYDFEGPERASALLGKAAESGFSNPHINIVTGGRSRIGGKNSGYSWNDCGLQSLFDSIGECTGYREKEGTANPASALSGYHSFTVSGFNVLFFGGPLDGQAATSTANWTVLRHIDIIFEGTQYVALNYSKNHVSVAYVPKGSDMDAKLKVMYYDQTNLLGDGDDESAWDAAEQEEDYRNDE